MHGGARRAAAGTGGTSGASAKTSTADAGHGGDTAIVLPRGLRLPTRLLCCRRRRSRREAPRQGRGGHRDRR